MFERGDENQLAGGELGAAIAESSATFAMRKPTRLFSPRQIYLKKQRSTQHDSKTPSNIPDVYIIVVVSEFQAMLLQAHWL